MENENGTNFFHTFTTCEELEVLVFDPCAVVFPSSFVFLASSLRCSESSAGVKPKKKNYAGSKNLCASSPTNVTRYKHTCIKSTN